MGAVAIDINMGCPVPRPSSTTMAFRFDGDPDYAAEVTAMAVESSELPVR